MIRTVSRATAALAAVLSVALLGLATGVAERVMRDAHAGASRAAAHSHSWNDLPPPATETVWCANDDAIFSACDTRPGEVRPELLH